VSKDVLQGVSKLESINDKLREPQDFMTQVEGITKGSSCALWL
jgi:hypothetical protein